MSSTIIRCTPVSTSGWYSGRWGTPHRRSTSGSSTLQRAALAQHVEHARGARFHQPARQLLPHPLGHQVVGLAVRHHLAHQLHGFGRHREIGETRRKARHAQDAHRVFAERVGHMAQHAVLQVALAAIRIKMACSAR
jgi:hypothetical protein